jgi:hypothetical protein
MMRRSSGSSAAPASCAPTRFCPAAVAARERSGRVRLQTPCAGPPGAQRQRLPAPTPCPCSPPSFIPFTCCACTTRAACCCTASTTRGWQWPVDVTPMPAAAGQGGRGCAVCLINPAQAPDDAPAQRSRIPQPSTRPSTPPPCVPAPLFAAPAPPDAMSRYLRPWLSQSQLPSPRVMNTSFWGGGGGAGCRLGSGPGCREPRPLDHGQGQGGRDGCFVWLPSQWAREPRGRGRCGRAVAAGGRRRRGWARAAAAAGGALARRAATAVCAAQGGPRAPRRQRAINGAPPAPLRARCAAPGRPAGRGDPPHVELVHARRQVAYDSLKALLRERFSARCRYAARHGRRRGVARVGRGLWAPGRRDR